MKMTTTSKKLALAAILTSGLTLAISQSVLAQPDQGADSWKGQAPCSQNLDPAMQKARDKFLADTVELRKQMAEKHAVMRAIMKAGTPDTVKAGQVAGELFDLSEQLRAKAKEAGLPYPMMGFGCGEGMGEHMGMMHDGMMGKGMMGKGHHHRM